MNSGRFLYRVARVRPMRLVLGLLCMVLAVVALVRGIHGTDPVKREVERLNADLRSSDPEAAAFFQRQSDKRSVAALLRAAKQIDGDSCLQSLVHDFRNGDAESRARLLRLSFDPRLAPDSDARASVLRSHGQVLALLSEAKVEQSSVSSYLDTLEESAGSAEWDLLRDDPASLQVWKLLRKDHPELWDYYVRNRSWLAEALTEIEPAADTDPSALIVDTIARAKTFDPLPREAVEKHGFGPFGLLLFQEYGPIIQEMVRLGTPLEESLELVFVNQDRMQILAKIGPGPAFQERVGHLAWIRKGKPHVWEAARQRTQVLWLGEQAPDVVDRVVETYGDQDIANFIFLNYEKDAHLAALAISRFGPVAFYYLRTYHDHERFRSELRNQKLGVRIIPFLAKFGEEGFAKLDANAKWLDEYFDQDGHEMKPPGEWLTAVPFVGAPAFLIQKLAQGRAISGSDVGWAAFDVADTALWIASLGTSSGATALVEVAKSGSAKIGRKEALEQLAKSSMKKLPVLAEEAAIKGPWKSVRAVLKTAGSVTGEVAKLPVRVLKQTWRAAKAGAETWSRVPPKVRTWSYRGLLGVSLYFVINHRTIPQLGLAFESLAQTAHDLSKTLASGAKATILEAMHGAVEGLLKDTLPAGTERMLRLMVLVVVVGVLLLTSAVFLGPIFRRSPQVSIGAA